MPRTLRNVLPHTPHHVITRGNNRRRLFSHYPDYARFVRDVVQALAKEPDCRLHSMTMMANHVHMVVTPSNAESLARFVKISSQRYAQYRNQRRETTGKLFEQRYHSFPITSERQLAATIGYVELNALRSGIVEDPLRYKWSTFCIHAGRPELSAIALAAWSPSAWYEGLAEDPVERALQYREWIYSYSHGESDIAGRAEIELIEALSTTHYTKRLERPDRSRASDGGSDLYDLTEE